MTRAARLVALALLACALAAAAARATHTAFRALTANPASSFQAKQIFPGQRPTSAWDLRDASSGSLTDQSSPVAFGGDGRTRTTTAWATAFNASRYLELDFSGPLPAGLSTSSVALNLRLLPGLPIGTACYYFEVRRASTGAVVATHGNESTPVACESGATYTTVSTPLGSVTSTDLANDLRIRLFARDSLVQPILLDLATISGSTPHGSFTLYEKVFVDAADTTPATTRWPIASSGDGASYDPTWTGSFDATRYLKFTFPGYVPTGAVVTAASLEHSYRSLAPAAWTCHWFEVYNGAALIGSHGSDTSPYSCATGASYLSETVSLPEIDTVAEANNAIVKMFVRNNAGGASQHDLVNLVLTYHLN